MNVRRTVLAVVVALVGCGSAATTRPGGSGGMAGGGAGGGMTGGLGTELKGATVVEAGIVHTCALVTDGTVWCWGDNSKGELGHSATSPLCDPNTAGCFIYSAARVEGLPLVVQIAAGRSHTCARGQDGSVWCWGQNDAGGIGAGGSALTSTSVPLRVPDVDNATMLFANWDGTCANLADNTVKCWGMGDTTGEKVFSPRILTGVTSLRDVTTFLGSKLVLSDGSYAEFAGYSTPPKILDTVSHVVKLQSGGFMPGPALCAKHEDDTMTCWGFNNSGVSGNGIADFNQAPPASPLGVGKIRDFDLGYALAGSLAAAVTTDNKVWLWGKNGIHTSVNYLGSKPNTLSTPEMVPDLSEAVNVTVGGAHICALMADTTVRCWGNMFALGHGDRASVVAAGTETVAVTVR